MKKLLIVLGIIASATLPLKELPVVRAEALSLKQLRSKQQQLTPIPGTRVLLVPPENFVPATRFPGYQQEDTNTSIVVTEIPAPVSELARGLTLSEELAKDNLLLLEREEVTVAQQQALLLKLQQTAYGTVFGKWVLLLGNETQSVLVTATFPQDLEQEYSQRLKRSLLTLELERDRPLTQTDDLPFTIKEYGDLQLAQRVSNALLYSKDGIFPASSVDDPIFIVAPSVSPQYADPEAFARKRLLAIENVTEIEIQEMTEVVIDGLDGYEIVAQGKDQDEEEITVYQTILFEDNSYYYLLQGQISNRLSQQYLPIFKQTARSFKRQ